jgi:hypothetical protein
MTTIPKPKHCGQNWLEMTPSEGGRICGQCDKIIVDFSKKSWKEIEQIQQQNNNALCGMYRQKQLDNWGSEIGSSKENLLKVAAITGLTITLALSAHAQTNDTIDKVVIRGHVIDNQTGEDVLFANVAMKNRNLYTTTDIEGNFSFVIPKLTSDTMTETLEVWVVGYTSVQVTFQSLKPVITNNNNVSLNGDKLNITLSSNELEITAFYVTEPTRKQRMKSKFRKWFGTKKN